MSWASLKLKAWELEQAAREAERQAEEMRCRDTDSGGARCTADATPGHYHRYLTTELPCYPLAVKP